MTQLPQQLALKVQLRDDATLENYFCAPSTQTLVELLRGQLAPGGEPIIYLYGPADVGKTHLLQAACHLVKETPAVYLPLAQLSCYPAEEVMHGAESMGLVCLDDIDTVMGNEEWEVALFHFFNRAREQNCRLLVAGHSAPRELEVDLADLRSRLSWGIVYQLNALNDDERKSILSFRAACRGLQLPSEVASYIADRAPRSMGQLLDLLATLDSLSLMEKRALSIPFIKKVLNW